MFSSTRLFGLAADLLLELSKHRVPSSEVVGEDPPRNAQQISKQRITHGIPDRRPLLPRDDDVPAPKHGELLRDDGLSEIELALQFLDAAFAAHQDLEQPDPHGMRQRPEHVRLEDLKLFLAFSHGHEMN